MNDNRPDRAGQASQGEIREITLHSTHLYPFRSAREYRLTGIASRCDWVLLSARRRPHIYLHYNVATKRPRHIFLCLRSAYDAIRYFAEHVLPTIRAPFVLVSGSNDITFPRQIDRRRRPFDEQERLYIDQILASPYLTRWFCQNLDDTSIPKMSPLPLGVLDIEHNPGGKVKIRPMTRLAERPLKVLCAHRHHDELLDSEGRVQWDTRRRVTEIAATKWSPWCTVLTEEVPEEEYFELVRQHAFVLCVEAGGLDPSPRAWKTLLNGAIPIMRETTLKEAYDEFPVAYVRSWEAESITEATLRAWYERFSKLYEEDGFQSSVYHKLGLDYWWAKIEACVDLSVRRPRSISISIRQRLNVVVNFMTHISRLNFRSLLLRALRRLAGRAG